MVDDATGNSGLINRRLVPHHHLAEPDHDGGDGGSESVDLRAERHPDGDGRLRRQPGDEQDRSSSATAAPTSVRPVPVDADGVATLVTSTLSVGSHPITATYGGTDTLATSSRPAVSQVVNKTPDDHAGAQARTRRPLVTR